MHRGRHGHKRLDSQSGSDQSVAADLDPGLRLLVGPACAFSSLHHHHRLPFARRARMAPQQFTTVDLTPRRHHGYAVLLFIFGTLFPPLGASSITTYSSPLAHYPSSRCSAVWHRFRLLVKRRAHNMRVHPRCALSLLFSGTRILTQPSQVTSTTSISR